MEAINQAFALQISFKDYFAISYITIEYRVWIGKKIPDDQNKFLNIDSKISSINNSKNSIYVLDNMETIDMLT